MAEMQIQTDLVPEPEAKSEDFEYVAPASEVDEEEEEEVQEVP